MGVPKKESFMFKKSSRYLSFALVLSMLLTITPAFNIGVLAADDIGYLDAAGDRQYKDFSEATALASASETTTLDDKGETGGWYYVPENTGITYSKGLIIEGDVNIILSNGSGLTSNGTENNAGIQVNSGNSLTIYANSNAEATMGVLNARGASRGAGIGGTWRNTGGNGTGEAGGAVTINGGKITATGNGDGAGIGTSWVAYTNIASSGAITINGGIVNAITGNNSAGIGGGGGSNGKTVVINGGTVTATAGAQGAGIGGGMNSTDGGALTINGGSVKMVHGSGVRDHSIPAPKTTGGDAAVLIKLANQAGVQSVMVDGFDYNISANHPGDNSLYLYLPATAPMSAVSVTIGGMQTDYYAYNGSCYKIVPCTVVYDIGSGTTGTQPIQANVETIDKITLPMQNDLINGEKVLHGWSDGAVMSAPGAEYTVLGDTILTAVWYDGPIPYLDETGSPAQHAAMLLKDSGTPQKLVDGWYYVAGDVSCIGGLEIVGDVHLILADNSHLDIADAWHGCAGIQVQGTNSLTIYANSTNAAEMGKITVTGDYSGAGIGSGFGAEAGTITINGGEIISFGGFNGAGIGGGDQSNGGNIIINGGAITAIGGDFGAGIGGGKNGNNGKTTINGGAVIAKCRGSWGAGIGGGYSDSGGGNGGTTVINGGTVTAMGGGFTPGIGGGEGGSGGGGGKLAINGGSVKITGVAEPRAINVPAPVTSSGTPVVLTKLENQAGVESVTIDGFDYNIGANHPDGDNSLYFYFTNSEMRRVFVTIGGVTTEYVYTNDEYHRVVSCAVTYEIDGASGTAPTQANVNTFEEITLPSKGNLEKDGKGLTGWNDGTKTYMPGANYSIMADTTFTAVWGNKTISYLDESGAQQLKDYAGTTRLSGDPSSTVTLNTSLSDGWYYVEEGETVAYPKGIIISGDVKIILSNGSKLTAVGGAGLAGVQVTAGNRLTIYSNSTKEDTMGKLTASGHGGAAGIGGEKPYSWVFGSSCGEVTITGGNITATGSADGGAGIGGGVSGSGGDILISGGIVTATAGAAGGCGIGRGGWYSTDGNVTISGGVVIANGNGGEAGIGSGTTSGSTKISGGTLTLNAANGCGMDGYDIIIDGGSIKGTIGNISNQWETITKTTNGEEVVLTILENQAGVQSVTINGIDHKISANHPGDDNLYFYFPIDTVHVVNVTINGNTTAYYCYNGVFYDIVPCTVTYDAGSGVTGTTPPSGTVNTLTKIILPTQGDLIKEEMYLFGWTDGTKVYSASEEYVVTGDTTLTALWGPKTINYIDEEGLPKGRNSAESIKLFGNTTSAVTLGAELTTTWYYIGEGETVTYPKGLVIKGDVHIILSDNSHLDISKVSKNKAGIEVEAGNSLSIYANSMEDSVAGTLTATGGGRGMTGPGSGAAIGGSGSKAGGTIVINGGVITAIGGAGSAAGIGGGGGGFSNNLTPGGDGGEITINGGTVTAIGGSARDEYTDSSGGGAGIGGAGTCSRHHGAGDGGVITINGGTVMASGGGASYGAGAGIGGAGGNSDTASGNGGVITINGGIITAIGGSEGGTTGAGIGGGGYAYVNNTGNGGVITINGGVVTANGGRGIEHTGAGIGGGGYRGNGGEITINGGTVIATGGAFEYAYGDGTYGAGIGGGGRQGKGGNIVITGGTVTAVAGDDGGSGLGAAIGGGGDSADSGTLKIGGGSVKMVHSGSVETKNIPSPVALDGTTPVYPVIIENRGSVKSVAVDGADYAIEANHPSDDDLYIHLPHASGSIERYLIKSAATAVKKYCYIWSNDEEKFVLNMYALDVLPVTVDSVQYGYAQPDGAEISIENMGGSAVTITNVTHTGEYAEHFEITEGDKTIAKDDINTSWKIRPKAGLEAGEYSAVITVVYDGGTEVSADLTFVVEKAEAPEIDFPTAGSEITYGEALSASTFNAASTYGTFAWTAPETVPSVVNNGFEVTFTPSGATVKNYETITATTATVAVAVAKKELPALADMQKNIRVGNPAEQTVIITGLPADSGADSYTIVDVSDRLGILNNSQTPTVLGGTVSFTLSGTGSPGDTAVITVSITTDNYTIDEVDIIVTLAELDVPDVSAQDINVVYSGSPVPETLIQGTASVNETEVSGSWSFTNTPPENVSDSGMVSVTFTPDDISYTSETAIIRVTIAKATRAFEDTENIAATYAAAQTLADIALPAGYAWQAPQMSLPAGDGQIFTAVYTDPSGNYEDVAGSVTINVAKAEQAAMALGAEVKDFYFGAAPFVPAVTGGTLDSTSATYLYEGINETSYASTTAMPTEIGHYKITATLAGDNNYNGVSAEKSFSILVNIGKNITSVFGQTPAWSGAGTQQDPKTAVVRVRNGFSRFDQTSLVWSEYATAAFGKAADPVEYGDVSLNVGANTIYIIVTAQNGAKAYYTLTVERLPSEGSSSSSDIKTHIIIFEYFDGKTLVKSERVSRNQNSELTAADLRVPTGYELVQESFRLIVTKEETVKIEVKKIEEPVPLPPPIQAEKPYVSGYPDDTFVPDGEITRAEVMQMLYNIAGDNAAADLSVLDKFSDMAAPGWADTALAWAVENSYLNGNADGTLNPDQPISRAELAAVLNRMAVKKGLHGDIGERSTQFSDIDGHWANADITALAVKSIVNGYSDGTFRPNNKVTRVEAVVMLARLFERTQEFTADKTFTDVPETHWAYEYIMNAVNGN